MQWARRAAAAAPLSSRASAGVRGRARGAGGGGESGPAEPRASTTHAFLSSLTWNVYLIDFGIAVGMLTKPEFQ